MSTGSGRIRADAALAARGLAPTRTRAANLIRSGCVTLNGTPVVKPSEPVGEEDLLEITGDPLPWVGRGALKLERALDTFAVDPSHMICADIGASTGGFTEVLLRRGAARVYAVDVGSGQLAPSLAADPRVISMENCNARTLKRESFPEPVRLAVMDVSFISIRLILPALFDVVGPQGRIIALIKPQFEAGRSMIGKGGIVSGREAHRSVIASIAAFLSEYGWQLRGLDWSPVKGGSGNIEFLADIVCGTERSVSDGQIRTTVAEAHQALGKGVR